MIERIREIVRKIILTGLALFVAYTVVIIIILCCAIADDYLTKRMIRNFYYDSQDEFDIIEGYFKELYTEGLYSATLSEGCLWVDFDDVAKSEMLDVSGKPVNVAFNTIAEKYQDKSDYSPFDKIKVTYDKNGNMQMAIFVYNERLNVKKDEDGSGRTEICYLIYTDEEYENPDYYFIAINDIENFVGNWKVYKKIISDG